MRRTVPKPTGSIPRWNWTSDVAILTARPITGATRHCQVSHEWCSKHGGAGILREEWQGTVSWESPCQGLSHFRSICPYGLVVCNYIIVKYYVTFIFLELWKSLGLLGLWSKTSNRHMALLILAPALITKQEVEACLISRPTWAMENLYCI